MKALIVLLLIGSSAHAAIDRKFIVHIENKCQWINEKIPFDIRMNCVTDYLNCTTVGAGETDWSKLDDKCLKLKAKEREDAQLQD